MRAEGRGAPPGHATSRPGRPRPRTRAWESPWVSRWRAGHRHRRRRRRSSSPLGSGSLLAPTILASNLPSRQIRPRRARAGRAGAHRADVELSASPSRRPGAISSTLTGEVHGTASERRSASNPSPAGRPRRTSIRTVVSSSRPAVTYQTRSPWRATTIDEPARAIDLGATSRTRVTTVHKRAVIGYSLRLTVSRRSEASRARRR